jgi:hypothetical protein
MNEVNLQAMANQATALQSHRGGTGEVRYQSVELFTASGGALGLLRPGDTLVVRAHYKAAVPVSRPTFQIAVVDVDSGVVITTATSRPEEVPATVDGDGAIECRFDRLPLRPRQYVLRLAITDSHQLASYDLVTAGPRFAVTGTGGGVDSLADEEDGLVSLPFTFTHQAATASSVTLP